MSTQNHILVVLPPSPLLDPKGYEEWMQQHDNK